MNDPQSLSPTSFSHYPPQAHDFATKNLTLLRRIPLPLLSILLAQVIGYDTCFPAEQRSLARQCSYLESMDASAFKELMRPFAALQLTAEFSNLEWINHPRPFNEQLSAMLWSTQQIDAFRAAGLGYEEKLAAVLTGSPPPAPRFGIVLIGNKANPTKRALFRNLRSNGVLFDAVQPTGAFETITAFIKERAQTYPERYAHWYIDGGKPASDCSEAHGITVMSYEDLSHAAFRALNLIDDFASKPSEQQSSTPEAIQSFMASLGPKDLGLTNQVGDATLHEFQASVLTRGAGTQIFSTTFVQWTAREVLRRAQPISLLARFYPRQEMAPMSAMVRRNPLMQATDPQGSLIDADMGAYYTWLNLTRLAGSDQVRFLVWFEDHDQALAISPTLAHGTTSGSSVSMEQILRWMV